MCDTHRVTKRLQIPMVSEATFYIEFSVENFNIPKVVGKSVSFDASDLNLVLARPSAVMILLAAVGEKYPVYGGGFPPC